MPASQKQACTSLLAAAVVVACCVARVQCLGKYNPCSTPGPATKGYGFYVGVAFWPGGRVEDWLPAYDSSTGEWGLNPCNTTGNFNNTNISPSEYLAQNGVVTAAFELQVDTLMAMRINASDLERLFDGITTGYQVISAVVYRSGFRSEAVYVRSEDAYLSHGVGYVQNLALSAAFSSGQLTYLQWDDVTCNTCGGLVSKQCIVTATSQPQHACATVDTVCAMEDCSLDIYMGFTGDDRNSVALQTGFEISRINQYAVSTLYNNIAYQVFNVLNSAQEGNVGQVPDSEGTGDGAAS